MPLLSLGVLNTHHSANVKLVVISTLVCSAAWIADGTARPRRSGWKWQVPQLIQNAPDDVSRSWHPTRLATGLLLQCVDQTAEETKPARCRVRPEILPTPWLCVLPVPGLPITTAFWASCGTTDPPILISVCLTHDTEVNRQVLMYREASSFHSRAMERRAGPHLHLHNKCSITTRGSMLRIHHLVHQVTPGAGHAAIATPVCQPGHRVLFQSMITAHDSTSRPFSGWTQSVSVRCRLWHGSAATSCLRPVLMRCVFRRASTL
jgi:hypothetical protein